MRPVADRSRDLELLPGCGIPGHLRSPFQISELRGRNYFQVALSQVMSECSLVRRRKSVTSRLRNRKSRCPRSSVCSLHVRTVQRFRNCVTSRLRNPRSYPCSLWCRLRQLLRSSSYFQVAESQVISALHSARLAIKVIGNGLLPGCGIPGHLFAPFMSSSLPDRVLTRDCGPNHDINAVLERHK
jgi:hypothetical protein